VEDDAALERVLRDNLEFEGYEVATVTDGNTAIRRAKEFAPDLVLLDVSLPGKDGFEVCRLLRASREVSIIFLTVRGQKDDKLRGLSLGADDYVTKPFDLEEVIARIHAVLRRTRPHIDRLTLGRITIDFDALHAWDNGHQIELNHRDFALLRYLADRRGAVVSRSELLRGVWGYSDLPDTRAVDHAIGRLRKKIEPDVHHPKFIRTVHGDGYCLTITPEPNALPDSD
jgi:DNA-binding response OmpR family regulator